MNLMASGSGTGLGLMPGETQNPCGSKSFKQFMVKER